MNNNENMINNEPNTTSDFNNFDDYNPTLKSASVVQTDTNRIDGQNKCPLCGATEIFFYKGFLICGYCHNKFEGKKLVGLEENIENLNKRVITSASTNIEECDSLVTLKCSSCGAEVTINSDSSKQARCHWCRNTLSINKQMNNGIIPDVVLPFVVDKDEAYKIMKSFISDKKAFVNPRFKRHFKKKNIQGVYLPYMLVDINGHATFAGEGEHTVKKHVSPGSDKKEKFDVDIYSLVRDFDISINGLTIESSIDKLDTNSNNTNNILNSILPFDVENVVEWNANYMKGYTSESRDVNILDIRPFVMDQVKDIARFSANEEAQFYDRGIHWSTEHLDIKGEQWRTAHLPVWLYSFHDKKAKVNHYIAVNARTKEVMGSIPIFKPVFYVTYASIMIMLFILSFIYYDAMIMFMFLMLMYSGFMLGTYGRYRNSGMRHRHEKETSKKVSNVEKKDSIIKHKFEVSSWRMENANHRRVYGNDFK